MSVVKVDPNTFRQYGDIAAGIASTVTAAGTVDEAASVTSAATTFGLIGQEFLTSFAYAQANHFSAVSQLANVFKNTATVSHNAANSYSKSEQNSASGFTGDGSSSQ
ncbi:type VII secretion target [Nocardia miyunensis]|uniref:type VII secretion target n=1 Tax=Nocardia miyunensis TaxID=282684 RepID=UPI000830D0BE|nr:type VII secretion target [Nocardia miyunensis]